MRESDCKMVPDIQNFVLLLISVGFRSKHLIGNFQELGLRYFVINIYL